MHPDLFRLHAENESRHWWFVARRRIVTRLVHAVLRPGEGRTVVDVGCGTGATLAALADDYVCAGFDTSADAIAWARRRFPHVRFERGAIPDALQGTAADLVLVMDVMEHVRDDFLLLSQLLATVPPGAHVLVTVPADVALWSPHDVAFAHFRRYDRARLTALWEGLPVSVRLLSHFNSRLYPAIRAARFVSQLYGRGAGMAGTDVTLPPPPINALLRRAFEGEGRALESMIDGRRRSFRRGVSLIALLRREPGQVTPRKKPRALPPDQHDPESPGAGSEGGPHGPR